MKKKEQIPRVKFRSDSLAASLVNHPIKPAPEISPTRKHETTYGKAVADNLDEADEFLKEPISSCTNPVLIDELVPTDFHRRNNRLRRLMLDQAETYQRFLATIRVGAFLWVAAESIRISVGAIHNWLNKGETAKGGIYRRFYLDVMQAQAQARLTTEIQVRKDNPEFWLRNGPGKSRPGKPGWTETTVVEHGDQPLQVNVGGTVQHQHAHIHIPATADPSLGSNGQLPGNKSIKQLTQERANPTLSGVLTILEEIGIANLSKLGRSTQPEAEEAISVASAPSSSEEPVNSPSTPSEPIPVDAAPILKLPEKGKRSRVKKK